MKYSTPAILKWAVCFAIAEWLEIPSVMRALVILMIIDYGSGFIAACMHKEVSSNIGWYGLCRKMMTLVLLLMIHVLEMALGADWHFEQIGAFAYCVNEAVSAVENFAKIGVPIPAQLVSTLLSVKRLKAERATAEQLDELSKNS